MNKPLTIYHSFTRSIIYLMLIGQVWVNTIPYCVWMFEGETELIELCKTEDNESEEEETKKETDDKFKIQYDISGNDILILAINNLHMLDCLSLHHPEILTPPPEFLNS